LSYRRRKVIVNGNTPTRRHIMARAFALTARRPLADRYLIVPCEDGRGDLAVIWDRLEEQVIDVIDARQSARYAEEDALWDEARPMFDPAEDFRMAA